MANSPTDNMKSFRLREAVRGTATRAVVVNERKGRAADADKAGKSAQRPIKFANITTALRQHVHEAQKAPQIAPKVRLRVNPPAALSSAEQSARNTEQPTVPDSKRTAPQKLLPVFRGSAAPIVQVSDIGDVVRRVRRALDLSQADLAAKAGTGRRFVSELESGKPTIEFDRLLKVCQALGIKLQAHLQPDD